MIYRLVTLAEAKANARYDSTADDADIDRLVIDASQFVMDYLESTNPDLQPLFSSWTDADGFPLVDDDGNPIIIDYETDSNGDPLLDSNGDYIGGQSIIPGPVRRATLLAIASLDQNREGELDPITPAVRALLTRFRPPTVS
jgi:hypothetical protein